MLLAGLSLCIRLHLTCIRGILGTVCPEELYPHAGISKHKRLLLDASPVGPLLSAQERVGLL